MNIVVPFTVHPFFDVVANVADPLTVRGIVRVNDPVIVRLATSTGYPDWVTSPVRNTVSPTAGKDTAGVPPAETVHHDAKSDHNALVVASL